MPPRSSLVESLCDDAVEARLARQRLLAFAFAAADMLVEVNPEGVIRFAEGMFKSHFGASPEHFVGRPLATLIAPEDHAALAATLGLVLIRGRLPAQAFRLDDGARTPCALSAIAIAGATPRLCVTLGPLPARPAAGVQGTDAQDAIGFARLAEARARAGAGTLGLLEVKGWAEAAALLPADERRRLQGEVTQGLQARLGASAMLGELEAGQYGVLSGAELDLPELRNALEEVLRETHDGSALTVDGTMLPLAAKGLTQAQATRALRHALVSFAQSGRAGLEQEGFVNGLTGWIKRVQARGSGLRGAIASGHFNLLFQPIVRLADRRLAHYEALVRPIPTPSQRSSDSQEFVTCVEAVGLAEEFDLAVLDRALRTLVATPPAAIAVNVSAMSMQSASFRAATLTRIMADRAPRRRLLVELTETAEIEDVAAAASFIGELRAAGVAVCIDDFGAGAAGFRYLRDFRVDGVKIDGSYVQGAGKGERARDLVAAMVALAGSVSATVIAETIETEEQAALMLSLGVNEGQGWLFGRPGVLPGGLA